MDWLRINEFTPRPLVAVEDHVYHISELLRTISSSEPRLLASLTVVCLDRQGPDTDDAVDEWLESYPEIQVAARIEVPSRFVDQRHRVQYLRPDVFQTQHGYCKMLASLIRCRGLLLQDIDLETLDFVPRDRWWETTILASAVRGIIGERPPRCAFISNKRGFEATFGAELLAAGHDPRDVLNKYEIQRQVVPLLHQHIETSFPWRLVWAESASVGQSPIGDCLVSKESSEQSDIAALVDVVLWPEVDGESLLGGRCFKKSDPISLGVDGNEYQTWRQLIEARLQGGTGVEVVEIGERVAPSGALRAEVTNSAARHIHNLRKRLGSTKDIATVQGQYRLRDGLRVGQIVAAGRK